MLLPLPWVQGGSHTRGRGRGWGEPNSDEGTDTLVLYVRTHTVYVLRYNTFVVYRPSTYQSIRLRFRSQLWIVFTEKVKNTSPFVYRWIWLHPPPPASNIGKTPTCHIQRKFLKNDQEKGKGGGLTIYGDDRNGDGGAFPSFSHLFPFTSVISLVNHFTCKL